MKIDLTGKVAVVTGSTGGIGLAIARCLAECGARVVVNGRSQETVDRAVTQIETAVPGCRVSGFAVNLETGPGCAEMVRAVPKCDILVNNLGIYGQADFFDTPDDVWSKYYETNVLSGVRLCRAYMLDMVKNDWGRVVFVASESGLSIPDDQIHYGVSKTAQISLARGLAKRMAGTGVTVNSVLPGPTLSEGVAKLLNAEVDDGDQSLAEVAARFIESRRPSSIIRRAATPDEVASMVVYACSPQASATTGAALRVDGGIVDCI